jgi:hypothetical protein
VLLVTDGSGFAVGRSEIRFEVIFILFLIFAWIISETRFGGASSKCMILGVASAGTMLW